jgi:TolA-binding protein
MPKPPAQSKTLAAKVRPITNNAQKEALAAYTAAMDALQSGDFEKAADGFRSLDAQAPVEIRERARVHLAACERQVTQRTAALEFSGLSEQYDYAIALINNSDYEDAREQMEAIIAQDAAADYAHYGLAVLFSMTSQAEGCLHHLERAIEIDGNNRIKARSDSDFRQMSDDPRFTELLYPEAM